MSPCVLSRLRKTRSASAARPLRAEREAVGELQRGIPPALRGRPASSSTACSQASASSQARAPASGAGSGRRASPRALGTSGGAALSNCCALKHETPSEYCTAGTRARGRPPAQELRRGRAKRLGLGLHHAEVEARRAPARGLGRRRAARPAAPASPSAENAATEVARRRGARCPVGLTGEVAVQALALAVGDCAPSETLGLDEMVGRLVRPAELARSARRAGSGCSRSGESLAPLLLRQLQRPLQGAHGRLRPVERP